MDELKEKIVRILLQPRIRYGEMADQSPRYYSIASEFVPELVAQILALIKEAGYHRHVTDAEYYDSQERWNS